MDNSILDRDQTLRYSRQLILDEIGLHGQKRLLESKVLVIGAGGLGSPALHYLAGAGVGTLGVADFDTVGISNIHRQTLHFTDDLGRKKVDSAEDKLKRINPDVNIFKHNSRLKADNIESIIKGYDVIIDATDNFPARYLVSDCCYLLKKTLIEGAAVGFEGILMTIVPGQTPCYRCLYPMPPEDGVIPSCSDTGILGMITGTIGSLQGLEAIKVILGVGRTLSGRLLVFDGLELSFREIAIDKKDNCQLCSKNAIIKELENYEFKCRTKIIDICKNEE